MSEIGDEDFDLDVLMRRIRAKVESRKAAASATGSAQSASSTLPDIGSQPTVTPPPLNLARLSAAAVPVPSKERYTTEELLRYHDEEFLHYAYRAILRRDPDPNGLASFLDELRGGRVSRIEVLGRLRYSPEGRAAAVPVRGLALRFAVRSARRIPVLGRVIAILQYVLRLPEVVGSLERLESADFRRERDMRRQIDANSAAVESTLASISEQWSGQVAKRDDAIARTEARISGLERSMGGLESGLDRTRAELAGKAETAALDRVAEQAFAKADLEEVQRLASSVDAKADRTEVTDLARRVPTLIEDLAARFELLRAGADPRFDAFYGKLEDRFRGTRDAIGKRVEVYLPIVAAAGAGTERRPVVDLGCGRGEWLEVLATHGYAARGVDANAVMVAGCVERGLQVEPGDALDYLKASNSSSFGAVTAMHVVEHLRFGETLLLAEEALRVLCPGGVLILETPNPENVSVGANTFYLDPTHQRPIPPPLLQFVVEHLGFVDIETLRLHPRAAEEWPAEEELRGAAHLNQLFFGAQDYAIVARKSSAIVG